MVLSYLWDWAKRSWRDRERITRWVVALIFAIALLALADSLPPVPSESSKLVGSLLFLLTVWRFLANSSPLPSVAFVTVLSWLLLWVSLPLAAPLMAAFVLGVLAWRFNPAIHFWAAIAGSWAIVQFAFRNNPYLWHWLDRISEMFSYQFGERLFLPLGFSPTALGWDGWLMGFSLKITSCFFSRLSWQDWTIRFLLFFGWWLFCQLLFGSLVAAATFFWSWKGLGYPLTAVTLHPILVGLFLAVPCWWASEKQNFQPVTSQKGNWFLAIAGCWLAITFALSFAFPIPPKPTNPKVTILEPLMGEWLSPTDGKYGVYSWGMYGMLPRYLQALGCQKVYRTKKLTDEILSQTDVLMIFTPMRMPMAEEVQKVEKFVRQGGGLAVFSDHTDLEGIMARLNRWLKPFNASIPFDSAMYLYRDELPCFELRPHPITVGLDVSEIRIAIGSSVSIRPPLRPIVLFRLGFSDIGNYQNKERAFMGNESPDLNERIGDIVLVAAGRFGEGKVAVFGDTTTFQNSLLPESWRFIARLINWLSTPDDPLPLRLTESKFGIVLTLVSLLLIALPFSSPKVIALATLAGLIFHYGTVWQAQKIQQGQWRDVTEAVAVDLCHANDVSIARISEKATDGLNANLMRRGFLPFLTREDETQMPLKKLPKRLVIIEPLVPMSKRVADELLQWLRDGGKILVFASPTGGRNL
ncbi:MAG: hypothetical protein NZ805_15895, partial [Armatimonadetes bacterium]|nr:hypothetical protein [Armatimonadota bacterium]MDW8029928.1 hypothetical protein [Armatimonadota bacterium]